MIIVNEKNNTEYNSEEPSTTKKLIKVHLKNGLIFLMVFCKLLGMEHGAWSMEGEFVFVKLHLSTNC